jgi:outer membrane protein
MMKSRISLLCIAATLVLAAPGRAQLTGGRIVTVDLNRVFNEYHKRPIAEAKLRETAETFNKEHDEMMANYRKQIEELNKLREEQDKPEYSPEVREQKRKAVSEKLAETQKLQRDIEEYRTTHRRILEEQTARMRQNILKEINDVITKESRDAGYLLVLDRSGNTLNGVPAVVFSQDTIDITEHIISILNRGQPKSAETGRTP